jgi:hypothetical protein
MRNEYFRKVPLPGGTYEERILPEGSFAWRNVRACEYFRKVPFPSKNHRPVPGGTFELASTSERFLFRAIRAKTIALLKLGPLCAFCCLITASSACITGVASRY